MTHPINLRRALSLRDPVGTWPMRFNLRRFERADEAERERLRPVIAKQVERLAVTTGK